MKRTVLFLTAVILLVFGLQSCDREDNNGSGTTSVQWVDLGLPSGLLWADRNVGANSVEDYGNYYAWGETAPKEIYDWSTYAYGISPVELTKYCGGHEYNNGFTDNLTTLEASDDAATVNLGGGARMPGYNEWEELMRHTTSKWITRNGVHGLLLTGRSNGKSIFLPAAGYRFRSIFNNTGDGGYYWSSVLDMENPHFTWYFYFYSRTHQGISVDFRNCGFSVRAVRDK